MAKDYLTEKRDNETDSSRSKPVVDFAKSTQVPPMTHIEEDLSVSESD